MTKNVNFFKCTRKERKFWLRLWWNRMRKSDLIVSSRRTVKTASNCCGSAFQIAHPQYAHAPDSLAGLLRDTGAAAGRLDRRWALVAEERREEMESSRLISTQTCRPRHWYTRICSQNSSTTGISSVRPPRHGGKQNYSPVEAPCT